MPLEELELVGRKDLERNLAALKEACAAFAPKASLAACVDKMRANKPSGGTRRRRARAARGAAPVRASTRRSSRIPNQEQALVAESPPYNRGNFAYISIPGSVREPGREGDLLRRPARCEVECGGTQCLSARQGVPAVSSRRTRYGPDTTCSRSSRMPILRAPQALWWDYAFGEGWAHYAEEMMYDAGLGAGQPEMRVGMLTNALLRDVRFLSAICLHSGCMSLEESEKMFREQAFADAGNARQQALRGTYDPGYLAYTLGKLMIRKLRTDWLAANPGCDPQQFHDKFLSYGAPPIPLVRREDAGHTGRGALSPGTNYQARIASRRRVAGRGECVFVSRCVICVCAVRRTDRTSMGNGAKKADILSVRCRQSVGINAEGTSHKKCARISLCANQFYPRPLCVAIVGVALAQVEASSSTYSSRRRSGALRGSGRSAPGVARRRSAAAHHDRHPGRNLRAVAARRRKSEVISARVRALRPEPQIAAEVRVVAPDISPGTYRSTPWGLLLRAVPEQDRQVRDESRRWAPTTRRSARSKLTDFRAARR